jgi:hypothetical protein
MEVGKLKNSEIKNRNGFISPQPQGILSNVQVIRSEVNSTLVMLRCVNAIHALHSCFQQFQLQLNRIVHAIIIVIILLLIQNCE